MIVEKSTASFSLLSLTDLSFTFLIRLSYFLTGLFRDQLAITAKRTCSLLLTMNSLIMLLMLEHAGFWFSFRFDHFDLQSVFIATRGPCHSLLRFSIFTPVSMRIKSIWLLCSPLGVVQALNLLIVSWKTVLVSTRLFYFASSSTKYIPGPRGFSWNKFSAWERSRRDSLSLLSSQFGSILISVPY